MIGRVQREKNVKKNYYTLKEGNEKSLLRARLLIVQGLVKVHHNQNKGQESKTEICFVQGIL